MRSYVHPFVLVFFLLFNFDLTRAQEVGDLLPETRQYLIIADNSASMTEPGYDPASSQSSRWEILRTVYPQWLQRLDSNALVGVVSIGGECGSDPQVKLPVGSDRNLVASALDPITPNGHTNLNATLKMAPSLFRTDIQGGKRIVLLSDGLNTCHPNESTCDIVRDLHKDYGIRVDVIAWITDPGMIGEFNCVAQVSNGSLTVPSDMDEWINLPLFRFNPWRYVVLVLGLLTLFPASQLIYRQGYHSFRWTTRQSVLSATVFLCLGGLILYLVLFAGAGLIAAALGALVLAATIRLGALRPKDYSFSEESIRRGQWTFLLIFLMVLIIPKPVRADTSSFPSDPAQRVPRFHHTLVLDVSGSIIGELWKMKEFLARYAQKYVLPGEEVSLIIFAYDEHGSIKEVCTFTTPRDGSAYTLTRALDDLVIPKPKETKTYFKPLADYLNHFLLKQVRLQPVVLIVSDGKSDASKSARNNGLPFKEISFESLATHGIYKLKGTNNWKVAVQGGSGLDLASLFQRPMNLSDSRDRNSGQLSPAINPCLIEPALVVTTDEVLVLRPDMNPFTNERNGSVTIQIRNECVSRFRSFEAELTLGTEKVSLGRVEHRMIDQDPVTFSFPVSMPSSTLRIREATLRILLDQGNTTRAIYPEGPPFIRVEEPSYWTSYGLYWIAAGGTFLLLSGFFGIALKRRREAKEGRPEVVKILGGPGVPLARNRFTALGGEGCTLTIPGVPAGLVLGSAEWTGVRNQLILRSENGFRMRMNRVDALNGSVYHLGQSLEFIHPETGASYNAVLHSGTVGDIGFGATPPHRGHDVFKGASSASDFSSPGFPPPGGTPGLGRSGNGNGQSSLI